MRFKSSIAADSMSGTSGGITASRNRYGKYFRSAVLHVNKNTNLQNAARAIFRTVSHLWTLISPSARQAWTDYANAVSVTDKKMGGRMFLSANAMFLRNVSTVRNVNATPAAQALGDQYAGSAAPVVLSLPSFTPPTVTLTPNTSACSIAFNALDGWSTHAGGILIQASPPLSPATTFYKGPYRIVDSIQSGDTSPISFNLGSANGPAGSKRAFRFVCIEAPTQDTPPTVSEANHQLIAA